MNYFWLRVRERGRSTHLYIQSRDAEAVPDCARQAKNEPVQRRRLRRQLAGRREALACNQPHLAREFNGAKVTALAVRSGRNKHGQGVRVVEESGDIGLKWSQLGG